MPAQVTVESGPAIAIIQPRREHDHASPQHAPNSASRTWGWCSVRGAREIAVWCVMRTSVRGVLSYRLDKGVWLGDLASGRAAWALDEHGDQEARAME